MHATNDLIGKLRAQYLEQQRRRFDNLTLTLAWSEVPAARVLLAQMLVDHWEFPDQMRWRDERIIAESIGIEKASSILASDECMCACVVGASLQLGGDNLVTIDMAFFGRRYYPGRGDPDAGLPVKIAVELSPQDLHERIEEQGRAERRMLVAGWQTLRFSGGDVTADPAKVLEAIVVAANRPWEV